MPIEDLNQRTHVANQVNPLISIPLTHELEPRDGHDPGDGIATAAHHYRRIAFDLSSLREELIRNGLYGQLSPARTVLGDASMLLDELASGLLASELPDRIARRP